MPESLITEDPDEAQAFVRENDATILKEPRSCGGQGHVVLVADDAGTIVGETPGRRYLVELQSGEGERAIDGNVLFLHPPFYVQRLIASVGRDRKLRPAQVLRAYVVDGQVVLWTERYRPRAEHPADFIISIRLGGRYRFLREVSEEAQKIALRAAEVMGVRVGAVDLIRAAPEGPMVLELDTDGPHLHIDRSFMELPEFRAPQDIDRFIGESIAAAARAPRPQPRTRERLRRIPHPKHATARRR